jgi:hypothetical protein
MLFHSKATHQPLISHLLATPMVPLVELQAPTSVCKTSEKHMKIPYNSLGGRPPLSQQVSHSNWEAEQESKVTIPLQR